MKHIDLLKRCHALLRRVDTVTPEGRVSQDGDRLAKEINDYLNGLNHAVPDVQSECQDSRNPNHNWWIKAKEI
jgi:Leu/Phe-tRNA-protein transferase